MMNPKMKGDGMRASGTRASLGIGFISLVLCFSAIGCESETTDPTGGETHFLRVCDPEADTCEDGLSCICGVCTTVCGVEDPCATYAGAQCVAPPPSCKVVERACDVQCSSNKDCWDLSSAHYCIDGWCRLASGTAVDTEPPIGGGGMESDPPSVCEPSGISGNEVIILGDSFFAMSHEVTAHLEALARGAGVLSDVERYRDYSNLTENSLASESGILAQYYLARDDAPVSVVIMNGGGADLLIGTCDPVDAECPAILDAATALGEVFAEMAIDGVDEVVFVSYPDPQIPELLEKMEVLRPLLEEQCASSEVPCSFLELQPVFSGKEDEYIAEDGLNPTSEGAQAAAGAIWELMVDSCIAQ